MADGSKTLFRLEHDRVLGERPDVATSQRGRMLRAMAEAVADKGYAATVVADVLIRAGVSRRTFYEQFSNKQDCFLAAYDAGVDVLTTNVAGAVDPRWSAVEQLDRCLEVYLDVLAREPAFAKAYLVEIYAAGPQSIERRRRVTGHFTQMLKTLRAQLRREGRPVRSLDAFGYEILIGAVSSIVTTRVATGRAAELPRSKDPLVTFLIDNVLDTSP